MIVNKVKIISFIQAFNAKHPDYEPLTDLELINFLGGYVTKGKDLFHEEYMNITEKYARKPLLTFSPGFSYDRVNKQAIYSFASDFTVGLGSNPAKKPWELEVKASFRIENDTANKKTNYDSKLFSISAAVNKVLLQSNENESKMEFKFFTSVCYFLIIHLAPPGWRPGRLPQPALPRYATELTAITSQ